MTAHISQRRPTKANSSQRRPTQAHESPQQPTQANAGPRKPTAANEGQRQPTAANAGPRRPTAANDGQRRPTQAHEDKKGPNDARWRRLGPRYVFFFIFFILFLLLRDSGHPTRTRTPRNPYPGTRVRVFWGTGTGSPGKPQGYPCQSLDVELGRDRIISWRSSSSPRKMACIDDSMGVWVADICVVAVRKDLSQVVTKSIECQSSSESKYDQRSL